jgi:translation initiation factor IF-2
LAAEFGVAPEQLLSMLKDMNIFVRSHLSALESDQVSAVRVRWEREKRRSAEEPTVKKGRRKAVKAEAAPVAAEAKPTKRRRTAAEVAQVEAQVQAEKAAELAALELERPVIHETEEATPAQTLEERARALFKDLPPAPPETEESEMATEEEPVSAPAATPIRAPFIPPRVQRPTVPPAAVPSRFSAAATRRQPPVGRVVHLARGVRVVPEATGPPRCAPSAPTPRRVVEGKKERKASAPQ